jgi:ribosomal-protein-alanine N-acetyltransferase
LLSALRQKKVSGALISGSTRSDWGHGFALEAAEAIIEFGFSRLGATVIRAARATWNVRSHRVIEKLGMRFVRENPCEFKKNGKTVPELEYALTNEEQPDLKYDK